MQDQYLLCSDSKDHYQICNFPGQVLDIICLLYNERALHNCYTGFQKVSHQNLHKQIIILILKWRETPSFSYGKSKSQPLRATTQQWRNAYNLFRAYRTSRRELVQQKVQSTASDPAGLSVSLLVISFARSENFYRYQLKYSSCIRELSDRD